MLPKPDPVSAQAEKQVNAGVKMNKYERYGEYAEQQSGNTALIIGSLLIGIGVGAVVSLLLAPKSGQETRQLLRRKYDETLRGISQQAGNLRNRGAELVDATRNKVMPFTRREERA